MNINKIKEEQLRMNPGTASYRLVKDVLFKFICDTGNNKCYHCGEEMSREDYSIEHKTPWLHSENPVDLFFDLDNISFSHMGCNRKAARKAEKPIIHGGVRGWKRGCRCEKCLEAKAAEKRAYSQKKKATLVCHP